MSPNSVRNYENIIIPKSMANAIINLSVLLFGTMSPKPTVVSVVTAKYIN